VRFCLAVILAIGTSLSFNLAIKVIFVDLKGGKPMDSPEQEYKEAVHVRLTGTCCALSANKQETLADNVAKAVYRDFHECASPWLSHTKWSDYYAVVGCDDKVEVGNYVVCEFTIVGFSTDSSRHIETTNSRWYGGRLVDGVSAKTFKRWGIVHKYDVCSYTEHSSFFEARPALVENSHLGYTKGEKLPSGPMFWLGEFLEWEALIVPRLRTFMSVDQVLRGLLHSKNFSSVLLRSLKTRYHG
jgi:hypothetical protein